MTLSPAEIPWLNQPDRSVESHLVYTTPEGNKTHGLYAYQGAEPGPALKNIMLDEYLQTCHQADAFLIDSPEALYEHLVMLLRPLSLADDGDVPACLLQQTRTDNARDAGATQSEQSQSDGPESGREAKNGEVDVNKDNTEEETVVNSESDDIGFGDFDLDSDSEYDDEIDSIVHLRIGISISEVHKTQSRVLVEKIYLCIRGKILIIDVLKSIYNDMDSKGVDLLRWLLTSKQITVHGLHAAKIVAHLFYYHDIVSTIRDMAIWKFRRTTSIHSIIDLQYQCKQAIRDPDLQYLSVPLEVKKVDYIFHSFRDADLIQEAFFCALLAQEYPSNDRVMTSRCKWTIPKYRAMEELVDMIDKHTFTDLIAPQRLQFARLENNTSKSLWDGSTLTELSIWVYTHSKEDLIMPSKKVVLRFDLSYCYWDQDDNKREGKKVPYIKSTMFGQVIGSQKKHHRMLVHFPRGIQAFHGCPNVPIEVLRARRYDDSDVPTYEPFLVSDPRLVVEISVYGNRQPSQEDLEIYNRAFYLLRA